MEADTYTTNLSGTCSGQGIAFDDTPAFAIIPTSFISKIVIQYSTIIYSLGIYYSWNQGRVVTHGGQGGKSAELTFDTGETIISIIGYAQEHVILGLKFVTNKKTWGPFGGTNGKIFEWSGPPLRRMRIVAFSGFASTWLIGLRAVFAGEHETLSKTIRYECTLESATPGQIEVSKSFSNYTCHLMNPIVALCVGEQRVKLNVHQDTLCQLPFFKAALMGGFREASDQAIKMPEDDPEHLSALIEFLYTGNYTYQYERQSVQLKEGLTIPVGDLNEGLFHLGIYTTAGKYQCPGLVKLATQHFKIVVRELDSINALRLWKAVYTAEVEFPGLGKGFQQYRSRDGLVAWVKVLFKDHREEMDDTMLEFPMLSADLLRITTGDDY